LIDILNEDVRSDLSHHERKLIHICLTFYPHSCGVVKGSSHRRL
jgi:hypothetical protein